MANCIVIPNSTPATGNGLDLPALGDFAYVSEMMLGFARTYGRGIYARNAGISVQVAGSAFGHIGYGYGYGAGM